MPRLGYPLRRRSPVFIDSLLNPPFYPICAAEPADIQQSSQSGSDCRRHSGREQSSRKRRQSIRLNPSQRYTRPQTHNRAAQDHQDCARLACAGHELADSSACPKVKRRSDDRHHQPHSVEQEGPLVVLVGRKVPYEGAESRNQASSNNDAECDPQRYPRIVPPPTEHGDLEIERSDGFRRVGIRFNPGLGVYHAPTTRDVLELLLYLFQPGSQALLVQ
jgi:hypothetical protein